MTCAYGNSAIDYVALLQIPFALFVPCFFLVFLDKSQWDFWVKHPLGTEKSFVLGWQVLYWVQLSQDNDHILLHFQS